MKALTIRQPWATLITIGAKRIETRSWSTNYRGPLAIHASKAFPLADQELCAAAPFSSALVGVPVLPRGAVIATCRLVAVHPVASSALRAWGSEHEVAFGDYSVGRYAWLLADVQPLPEPVPAKGALGLWEWT